jgi:excisionase family DNA binding protein
MTRRGKRQYGGKEMLENWSAKTDPQPGAAMPQLMDAKDVALILKIAPKTVHKLVRKGKLGCVQVTEKDRRFTREQVQAYIESQTVTVRFDKKSTKPVRSTPPKGGEKSLGVSRTSLLKEMSQWQ